MIEVPDLTTQSVRWIQDRGDHETGTFIQEDQIWRSAPPTQNEPPNGGRSFTVETYCVEARTPQPDWEQRHCWQPAEATTRRGAQGAAAPTRWPAPTAR